MLTGGSPHARLQRAAFLTSQVRRFLFLIVCFQSQRNLKSFLHTHILWFWSFLSTVVSGGPDGGRVLYSCPRLTDPTCLWPSCSAVGSNRSLRPGIPWSLTVSSSVASCPLYVTWISSCSKGWVCRSPCAPLLTSSFLLVEITFASVKLLCSAWQGFLCTRPALQVGYSPATCNSAERCPVYKVPVSWAVS